MDSSEDSKVSSCQIFDRHSADIGQTFDGYSTDIRQILFDIETV